jgi:protein-tyrosine-phosphatase
MAEGFARTYGSDVFAPHSAGIRPATRISRRTCAVMEEKGILIDDRYSTKSVASFQLDDFDAIVNLSEYSLPDTSAIVLRRVLRDPARGDDDAFRDVRDDVEQLVRFLMVHFRVARQWHASANPLYSEECAAASSLSC